MLIGIISDTHNKLHRTTEAIQLFEQAKVEAIIHCGDICEQQILALFAGTPTYYVMGNNDDDGELRHAGQLMDHLHYLREGEIIELAGKRIGVTHGHLSRVTKEIIKQSPHFLLSGHTHFAADERYQNIRCINPGALHRASQYSVATLDLVTEQLRYLPIPA